MAGRLTLVTAAACLALAACSTAPKADADGAAALAGDSPIAIRARAEAAYSEGRFAEAVDEYTRLARAIPGEADYWYRLGNALVRTRRFEDAAFAYQRSVAIDGSNGRAWHNLGIVRIQQAQAAFAEGIKAGDPSGRVFQDSLRLSTRLYSLMEHGPDEADGSLPDTDKEVLP